MLVVRLRFPDLESTPLDLNTTLHSKTDTNGFYEFNDLCPCNDLNLTVWKWIEGPQMLINLNNDTVVNIEFNIDTTQGVNLTVLDNQGIPYKSGTIKLNSTTFFNGIRKGKTTIRGLKPGIYDFIIYRLRNSVKLSGKIPIYKDTIYDTTLILE